MKRLFLTLLVLGILTLGYSADTFNNAVTVSNSLGGAYVSYSVALGSDSTASQHAAPIFIGNVNDADAFIQSWTNAASDINILFHYSNDLVKWQAVSSTGLDAQSNTVKYDTLGIGDQTHFHKYRWLVIEADGQSGANTTDAIRMRIHFLADVKQPTASGQPLKHVFQATRSGTNP